MKTQKKKILLEASGCHVHLTDEAIEQLFGKGEQLRKRRDLSQPGEYLSEQRVRLVTRDGTLDRVAVLGPARKKIQVELSETDCRKLGIHAPVNLSGDLLGASDILIVGPVGEVKAEGSVIVARNHIHMRPEDAVEYGVSEGDTVCVEVESDRKVIFENVPVRINDNFMPAMHIDFDEANACDYRVGTEAFVISPSKDDQSCTIVQSQPDTEKIVQLVVSKIMEMMNMQQKQAEPAEPVCQTSEIIDRKVINEKLITEKLAKGYIETCKGDVIRVKKKVIITPAAKDIIRAAHKTIEVVED